MRPSMLRSAAMPGKFVLYHSRNFPIKLSLSSLAGVLLLLFVSVVTAQPDDVVITDTMQLPVKVRDFKEVIKRSCWPVDRRFGGRPL
ncbi:MAG: hypothetical protein GF401_06345 [Chitinivibrionales bacterium]|nr:hypothetical protein [Chitinivibrionales bacterium]